VLEQAHEVGATGPGGVYDTREAAVASRKNA